MAGDVIASQVLGAPAAALTLTGLNLADVILAEVITEGIMPAGAWDRTLLRFNSDATRDRYIWRVRNDDKTVGDSTNVGTYLAGLEMAHFSGPDIGANYRGANCAWLWRPGNSDSFKHVWVRGEMGISSPLYGLGTRGGGVWKKTEPITRIDVIPNAGGNFAAGCKIKLVALCRGTLDTYTPPTPSDSFTYANGAVPTPWLARFTTAGGITINGNALKFNATDAPGPCVIWNGYPFTPDQFSQITVTDLPDTPASHWVGPTTRNTITSVATDMGNDHYLGFAFNGTLQIYKKVAGTYTALGSSVGYVLALNDVLKLTSVGNLHTLYVNGVSKVSVSDASIPGAGQPGIAAYAQNCSVDSFLAGQL